MPAFALIGTFDGVKSAEPVGGKFCSPEISPPSLELFDGFFAEDIGVADCQNDVFGLTDFPSPPFDSALPLSLESGLTLWTKELVTAIREFLHQVAGSANRESILSVTAFEL